MPPAVLAAAPCDVSDTHRWAAEVVSFVPGPDVTPEYAVPANALGPPDFQEGRGAVSLGNRLPETALVVSFGGARLVDGPGADLRVVEQGPSAEPTEVAVSTDGVTWHVVGRVEGIAGEVDLAGKAPAGEAFRYVRLRTAAERRTRGPWAGPDVDAVGLLHTCPVRLDA